MLIFPEQRRSELLAQYDERVLKHQRLEKEKADKPAPRSNFNSFVTSLRKFLRTTGLANLTVSDLAMLDFEAKDWERIYQRKKKQSDAIPVSVLEAWGNIISDSKMTLPKESSHGRLD